MALAAVLAMFPLSRSGFWGSMAVTIMGGLLVATALTILFLRSLMASQGVGNPALVHLRQIITLSDIAAIVDSGRRSLHHLMVEVGSLDVLSS